ncbi:MAG: YraN family protein [bacterium]|nr:YraN family protein [bacterium]
MRNIKNTQKPFNLKIGELGEDIGCRFLKEKGFKILGRNYRKKWGEIDIIAEKSKKIHFVEVKSVSAKINDGNVTRETNFKPEDAIQNWKIKRLRRAIQSYLLEKKIFGSADWQFDILGIFIDYNKKISKVRFIQDMLL